MVTRPITLNRTIYNIITQYYYTIKIFPPDVILEIVNEAPIIQPNIILYFIIYTIWHLESVCSVHIKRL